MVHAELEGGLSCQVVIKSMTGRVALLMAGDRAGVKGVIIGGCLNEVKNSDKLTLYIKSPELGIVDCSPKNLQITSDYCLLDDQRQSDVQRLAEKCGTFFINPQGINCFISGVIWLQGSVRAVILKEFCKNGFETGEWDTEDLSQDELFQYITA